MLCSTFLSGQSRVKFKHLTVEQGLSNGRITSIVQDSLGFIWIGTKNGLNRYDSNTFKEYNQKNSKLSSNDISTLYVNRKSEIWIGTIGGGISVYNPKKDTFIIYKNSPTNNNSISSNDIYTFLEDSNGNMWIGTENGLNIFVEKTNSFKRYTYESNKSDPTGEAGIYSIIEEKNDVFWIGTYGAGLIKFDTDRETFTRICPNIKSVKNKSLDFINSLLFIDKEELLIGTNGNGLLKLNIKNNLISTVFSPHLNEKFSIVRTIKKDKNQNIWIGTDGQGLLKLSTDKKSKNSTIQYNNDSRLKTSLSNNTINAIFEDNQSNIWIGTAWKGIDVLENSDNVNFFYSDIKGYNSSPVLSIYREKSRLWMGTDGKGLSIYDLETKKIEQYDSKSKFSVGGDYIQCIKKINRKQYWIGTFANGLVLYELKKGKIKQYKRDKTSNSSLPYNDVRGIIELPNGNLWVGTWGGGLSYFNTKNEKFKNSRFNKNTSNSISSDNVTDILMGDFGKIWIATFGGGLNLYDPKTDIFTHYKVEENNRKSIGNNYVFSLIKDHEGNLWLGTKEGLNKFDINTHKFKRIKIGNTSNSNTIVGIIEDDNYNLWMSTKDGIFKYDYISKTIDKFKGISEEFHINSVYKDDKGLLYFGGDEGVVSFDPNHKPSNNFNPPVRFTDFKLFNKSVLADKNGILKNHISFEKNIVLKHNQNVFTFNFSALYYPSNKISYLIKMEGFDKDWINIGTQKSITYTNLSHGNYVFKVKKENSNWNKEEITKVNIEILSPFWKTWWAYTFYVILFVLFLFALQYYAFKWAEMKNKLKTEKIQREQEDKLHQLKQRFFTDISHEIRTPLTLITGSINTLLKSNSFDISAQKQLSVIKRNADKLFNLVNELLNFRKLETGHVNLNVAKNNSVSFVKEIYLTFSQHAINKGINYEFISSKDTILAWYDAVQLEKTIFNLLSNAFKFTKVGDSIKIEVAESKKHLIITVSDTGKGISKEKSPDIFKRFYQTGNNPEKSGFGIGLSIAKDIVELHSGEIKVQSTLHKGSTFTLKIPLGKSHFKESDFATITQNDENILSYTSLDKAHRNSNSEETFSGSSILLIEDNHHIRDYLKEILSKVYVIFEASNGKEGLEKAIEYVPDLVISDVMMPIMDGISFCNKLKTDVRISHIPVILLTARTLITDKIEGYETGADDYLTKPFNEDILNIRIKNLLHNRKILRDRFLKEGILSPKEITVNSPDEKFLSDLVSIIEAHIDESEFNIDELTRSIGMSHSSVYKKLKALTGMTIVGFFKDYRLKRAAQLLEKNMFSITDICFNVGYTDRRHFSQEFKKKYKMTPYTYAKKHLKKRE